MYCLCRHIGVQGAALPSMKRLSQSIGKPVKWTACEPGGIDRTLLQDQTIPILMYDDVVLFEDFIHDHGFVRLNVRTRVMPQCWFVLLRYWLRVDNVVMKVGTYYFNAGCVNAEIERSASFTWYNESAFS